MKNAVFWDITPCTSYKNRRTSILVFLRSLRRFLVAANVVFNTPILVILIMEVIRSSETSVLTRANLRYIPGDGILSL
jgi:hypothetical protein